MAFFALWIRHEISVSRKWLGNIINPTFWEMSPALLIDSMQPRDRVLWKFWGFSGLSSPRWDPKLILLPEQCAYCSAAIREGKFNEDLKKLFWSHLKDFAVRQKLAEIFIVQCDFTGKMTQPSSVTKISSTFWVSNPHGQNTTMCPKTHALDKNHWNRSQLISLYKVD